MGTRKCTVFAAVLLVVLAGCTFQTLDVRRPLVVATIPTEGERLRIVREQYPDEDATDLANSLRLSRGARNLFDIHKYNDWLASVPIGHLVEAINLVPSNPFAWVQLGAYLELNHQTEAAIRATERGLLLTDRRCVERACGDDLQRLRATANINLAMYRAAAERPLEALLALQQVTGWDLPAFEQLAYEWTTADVKSRIGDVAGAREALLAASMIQETDLSQNKKLLYEYPQYFGRQRSAIQIYMEAEVDVAAGELSCAEEHTTKAIALNPRLWDGYLLLANIQYAKKDYDTAVATLIGLEAAPTNEMFHPERLAYNLGNAYLARYEVRHQTADLNLASEAFARAAKTVSERFKREQNEARRAGAFRQAEAGEFFLDALSTTPAVYSDACNNLGTVFMYLAERAANEISRRNWTGEAEAQWRRALRDRSWPRRQLAYANLARLYALQLRLAAAADAADAALDIDPFNVVPLKALRDVAMNQSESAVEAEAANILARLVANRRWQYPAGTLDDIIAPIVRHLRARPQSNDIRRALFALEFAGASDERAAAVMRTAHEAFPDWIWPAVEMAQREIEHDRDWKSAEKLIEQVVDKPVRSQDWLGRRERGDALVLRAEFRERSGDLRGARRDLERALASGMSQHGMEELRVRIDGMLRKSGSPSASSLAVMPFDTIYAEDRRGWGHSLASTFSVAFRTAGGVGVRSLDRDGYDVADWNALTATEVGRISGIGAVLTGRYAKTRKLIVIDARVFDSLTGEEVFARRYEIPQSDLRNQQAKIAEDVLVALRLKAEIPLSDAVASAFSANPKAYADYMDGMDIMLTGLHGEPMLRRAASLFESAATRDKGFARAHAGVALALYGMSNLYVRPTEVMERAKNEAERSVELAPSAGEAQLALAVVRTWYDWKFSEGEKAFLAAAKLDPYNSTIHRSYGNYLAARGRFSEALREAQLAAEYAPLSAGAAIDVGFAMFYLKRWDEALAQADAALTLHPAMARAYLLRSWVYTSTGRWAEALAALDAAVTGSDATPLILSHRGVTYALKGEIGGAALVLRELQAIRASGKTYVLPLLDARVLAAMGRAAEARAKLQEAFYDRSESMVWLEVDPWLASLRGDRDFERLVREVRSEHVH